MSWQTTNCTRFPACPYDYAALEPYISKEQLTLHHTKHHQAYVTGANAIFEKLDKARKDKADLDIKATLKELSFHVGGYRLHNTFWENLAPAGKGGGGAPKGELAKAINEEFGSFERFEKKNSHRRPQLSRAPAGRFFQPGLTTHRLLMGE